MKPQGIPSFLRSFASDGVRGAWRAAVRVARVHRAQRAGLFVCEEDATPRPSSLKLDIVIAAIEKDLPTLPWVIQQARKNLLHPIDTIYVISPASPAIRQLCDVSECAFIDETQLLPDVLSQIFY